MIRSAEPRDFATRWRTFLVLWGLPLGIGAVVNILYDYGRLPLAVAYGLWIAAVVWFGLGCLANARRCGRVHCWVDGVGMPVLATAGVLSLAGLYALPLASFGIAFWGILAASFLVECVWTRYI